MKKIIGTLLVMGLFTMGFILIRINSQPIIPQEEKLYEKVQNKNTLDNEFERIWIGAPLKKKGHTLYDISIHFKEYLQVYMKVDTNNIQEDPEERGIYQISYSIGLLQDSETKELYIINPETKRAKVLDEFTTIYAVLDGVKKEDLEDYEQLSNKIVKHVMENLRYSERE